MVNAKNDIDKEKCKDILYLETLLKQNNIKTYDPDVLQRQIEICYGQTETLQERADTIRCHSGNILITPQDMKLAVNSLLPQTISNTEVQTRRFVREAKIINNKPLPMVPSREGVILPVKNRLMNENYDIISTPAAKKIFPLLEEQGQDHTK